MEHHRFLTISSFLLVLMGCILLVFPKEWFPNFYSPIFLGVIAVISPLLIHLPKWILKRSSPRKRKLVLEMRSVIAFSLLVNFAGELGLFQLYKYGFEYDKLAHFSVSMLFSFMLGESLKEWENFSVKKRILVTLLIVFASGILWEFFEASSDFLFKTKVWGVYGQHLVTDTYTDIFCNTLGGIAGIIISLLPKKNKKRPL